MGRACKRYRIFCNAYRKICRPNSGGDTAFLSLALLSDFYLTGRGCSRFWPPNSRCLQSVQFFTTIEMAKTTWMVVLVVCIVVYIIRTTTSYNTSNVVVLSAYAKNA